MASARTRFVSWLDAAAEFWLGYSLPPPGRAVAAAGWTPDPRDAYCRRCGTSVAPGEATGAGCGACRGRVGLADGVVRLGAYEGPLREWILDVKYRHAWVEMGELLGRRLGERLLDAGAVDPARLVAVPVPMPRLRRLHRGIDHARALARGVSGATGAPIVAALRRTGGPAQVTLSRSERQRRGGAGLVLAGRPAWSMSRGREGGAHRLAGRHVVLVDDVATTGATLRAATRRLRATGAGRIVAAVVAVADDPGRRREPDPPADPSLRARIRPVAGSPPASRARFSPI